jgi:hypothetical protein
MQAEGWNPGFVGRTRIALRKLRSIRATLAEITGRLIEKLELRRWKRIGNLRSIDLDVAALYQSFVHSIDISNGHFLAALCMNGAP